MLRRINRELTSERDSPKHVPSQVTLINYNSSGYARILLLMMGDGLSELPIHIHFDHHVGSTGRAYFPAYTECLRGDES